MWNPLSVTLTPDFFENTDKSLFGLNSVFIVITFFMYLFYVLNLLIRYIIIIIANIIIIIIIVFFIISLTF